MNKNLQGLVDAAEQKGAANMAMILGLSSGEITLRKAREVYGSWFMQRYKAGIINPVRIDGGAREIKYFSVLQILEQKIKDYAAAELK